MSLPLSFFAGGWSYWFVHRTSAWTVPTGYEAVGEFEASIVLRQQHERSPRWIQHFLSPLTFDGNFGGALADTFGELRCFKRRIQLPQPSQVEELEPEDVATTSELTWFELQLTDDLTDDPIADVSVEIELPDGTIQTLSSDADGVVRIDDLDPDTQRGSCTLRASMDGVGVGDVWRIAGTGDRRSSPPDDYVIHAQPPADAAPRQLGKVVAHRVRADDTLDMIAEQYETTVEALCTFNWGTSASDDVQGFLRDHVGCTRVDDDGKYRFTGQEVPGVVFIPQPLERAGLRLEYVHKLRLRRVTRVVERLESRIALDQTRGLIDQLGEKGFHLWMMTIFGTDVPLDAYRALHDALKDDSLVPPPIFLVSADRLGNHIAGYNRVTRAVLMDRTLPRAAEDNPEEAWTVAAALVEEFGHHLDILLRNEYSQKGGDAALDEGARFGYALFTRHEGDASTKDFADYHRDGEDVTLQLDWTPTDTYVDQLLGPDEQRADDFDVAVEYFGAGRGNPARQGHSFGHESIEDVLADSLEPLPSNADDATVARRQAHLKQIYYGNWMRDYSQVLTESTIRPDGDLPFAHGWFSIFSKQALTDVVAQLGAKEFEPDLVGNATLEPVLGNLGVYRTHEHIDNPKGLRDSRHIDPDLHGPVTAAEIAIDPSTMMKKYIAASGAGWTGAADYMVAELRAACRLGDNVRGRRRLGQGLHVLEDFYAHSNFCELALREVGVAVYPWTGPGGLPGGLYPVVTGMFGGLDTAASMILGIGEILGHPAAMCMTLAELRRNGTGAIIQQTRAAMTPLRIVCILAADIEPSIGAQARAAVAEIERLAPTSPVAAWAACNTIGHISHWLKTLFGFFAHQAGAIIDEAETMFLDSTSSTNPTHSQLAKDHDDHPLHVLAAHCARKAVFYVGQAVRRAWNHTGSADEVVQIARSFFIHPHHIQGPSLGHLHEMKDMIRTWSQRHRSEIEALPSEGDIDELRAWGHTIGEHHDALVEDPNGYLNRRIDDFQRLQRETRRLLMERGRELMDASEEEIQRFDEAIRQLYEGAP